MLIRSREYPKRLKIEIRRGIKKCDMQERIAFSKSGTKQVILKVHTPEQTMRNKIEAVTERKEMRDCFDIEFLLRMGVPLLASPARLARLKEVVLSFKKDDFSVTLGSLLEPDMRKYYIENKFTYLLEKLSFILNK